jgi:hypothetical protein
VPLESPPASELAREGLSKARGWLSRPARSWKNRALLQAGLSLLPLGHKVRSGSSGPRLQDLAALSRLPLDRGFGRYRLEELALRGSELLLIVGEDAPPASRCDGSESEANLSSSG